MSFTCSFFCCSAGPRDLHSFPTRRSSDLDLARQGRPRRDRIERGGARGGGLGRRVGLDLPGEGRGRRHQRSEEHTSELQSQSKLVCRLLLEKKTIKLFIRPASVCRSTGDV